MHHSRRDLGRRYATSGREIPEIDGEQDFPALQSVRVGVVTSDMGTGGYRIQTCEDPMVGDNGVLQTTPGAGSVGCEASYPSYAELRACEDTPPVAGAGDPLRRPSLQPLEGALLFLRGCASGGLRLTRSGSVRGCLHTL